MIGYDSKAVAKSKERRHRMDSKRATTLGVLRILKEYSDAQHVLSVRDIMKKLRTDYDINITDRRTIYAAIETLANKPFDYDITKYDNNKDEYYYARNGEADLESSQIQVVCDAVRAFPFVSEDATEEICSKLRGQLGIFEQKEIKRFSVGNPDKKTPNKELFLNIERLDEAITKGVKVKFDYYKYDIDLKLHKRREKKHTVNPYGLVYSADHYYLACIQCYNTKLMLYRVDLMKDVQLTDYPIDPAEEGFSYKDEIKYVLDGHLGKKIRVTMLVNKGDIGHIIYKFGSDIRVEDYDEDRCRVKLTTVEDGFRFWALHFVNCVEVLEPESVRNSIIEYIKGNRYGV